jgi:protein tyrosine/serine phosphatase
MQFKIDTKLNRIWAYINALFVEHTIFNIFWKNFHKIEDGVYRSAQMNPYSLKNYIKKYDLKLIISFRKDSLTSPLSLFERELCKEMNVDFQHISLSSRKIPTKEKLLELKNTFTNIKKPMLMHCKAGADRTSLAAVLYLYFNGYDLKKAMKEQLGFLKYGHIKNSGAGIIDYYFEKFLESGEKDLIEFTEKNRELLQNEFKPKGIFSFLNDTILRRE